MTDGIAPAPNNQAIRKAGQRRSSRSTPPIAAPTDTLRGSDIGPGHGIHVEGAEVAGLPIRSGNILDRANRQRGELLKRAKLPLMRIAEGPAQECPACWQGVHTGDEMVYLNDVWIHLACGVCPVCSYWIGKDSVEALGGIGRAHAACMPGDGI